MNWEEKGEGVDRGRIGRRPSVETCELGLTWEDALDAVEDRDGWRKCIAQCAALHGKVIQYSIRTFLLKVKMFCF